MIVFHNCTMLSLSSYFALLQFSSCAEPLSATLYDALVDLLGGHDHQRHGLREGSKAEGNHEDDGSGNWNVVAKLVHQQYGSFPHFYWTANCST